MSIKGRHIVLAAGVLGALLGASSPVMAQHGGGGGGGHGGGGGGGGAHSAGGGGGRGAAVGGGHFGGAAGNHFGGGARFAGGTRGYAGGTRGQAFAGGQVAHSAGYASSGYRASGYGGRGGYAYPGGAYRHGYSTGAYWGGGYWRGGYWPRAYYGYGYSWFLPVLPLAYATYWYSGIPYYYANDVYYTWNPSYDGYTASDPPPIAESAAAGADGSAIAPPVEPPSPGSTAASQVFMYPKNGQSEDQQSIDKRECQQWAASQAGAPNSADYRRAMLACIEGRGYSAN